eukprot:TRINITY_DN13638_c0_g1_i1.p1 TRINITY_DN13638_c0_g1~~TRINITY_DN13638_c0_g1_i1.p1  ORF type:complete len:337 (+),score=63.21 TRINITY_DN13638_c0_g1_i1:140-1012(+)
MEASTGGGSEGPSSFRKPGRPRRKPGKKTSEVSVFDIADAIPGGRDMANIMATRVQMRWRFYIARRRKVQNYYAARIQAHWRGFKARKHANVIQRENKGDKMLWWVAAHQQKLPSKDTQPVPKEDKEVLKEQKAKLEKKTSRILLWVDKAKDRAIGRTPSTSDSPEEDIKKAVAREKKRRRAKRAAKRGLPRWFVYFAYFGCFAFCGICSYFILLYGLKFDPAVLRAWILASVFALFIEFFIQDPAIILGMSVLRVYIQEQYAIYKSKKEATLEANRRARRNSTRSRTAT